MGLKKRVVQLEKQVQHLEQILLCTEKFMEQYLKENGEKMEVYHRFSTDSAMEDIYCFIESIKNRFKKLENKEN